MEYFSGSQLRSAREALELSRRETVIRLAGAGVEITEKTLLQWEHGRSEPFASQLYALAIVLEQPGEGWPFFSPDCTGVSDTEIQERVSA